MGVLSFALSGLGGSLGVAGSGGAGCGLLLVVLGAVVVVRGTGSHVGSVLLAHGIALGLEGVGFHTRLGSLRSCLRVFRFTLGSLSFALSGLGGSLGSVCCFHSQIQRSNGLSDGRLLYGCRGVICWPGALIDRDGHLVSRFSVGCSVMEKQPCVDRMAGEKILIRDGHTVLVADLCLGIPAILVVAEMHLIRRRKIFNATELQQLSIVILPQRRG